MLDLEQKITEWRRQMLAAGIKPPMTLDELENHLREDIRAHISAGNSEEQAFHLAVSRVGTPGALRTEFRKLKRPACWPEKIGRWLFAVLVMVMAVWLSRRMLAGRLSLLLAVHVFTITLGYGAGFFAGGFGIFYVCYRLFHALSLDRRQSLHRAVLLFSQLSAGLVIAGFVLAMVWSHQHYGKYLLGDPKEAGGLGVAIWFVVLSVMQRRRMSERAVMLMCLGGNIMVSLAWFGANFLDASRKMQTSTVGYWPVAFAVFLGIQILFLVMGLAPAPEKVAK
jgi:hypothetical protein